MDAHRTERLVLRAPCRSDAAGFRALSADSDAARYLAMSGADEAGIAAMLDEFAEETAHGWAVHWSCVDRRDGTFIGYAALHAPESAEPVISFGVVPSRRRQGYGAAVVRAVMDYAAALPHVASLVAQVHLDNEASAALLRSLGFVESGPVDVNGGARREFRRWRTRQASLPEQ